jgi:hypothetical protein
MASEMVCPNCGCEDSIDWKYDAWACFQITGVDAHGRLLKGTDFDTQVFDHNRIECSACSRLFEEREIVELLRHAVESVEE